MVVSTGVTQPRPPRHGCLVTPARLNAETSDRVKRLGLNAPRRLWDRDGSDWRTGALDAAWRRSPPSAHGATPTSQVQLRRHRILTCFTAPVHVAHHRPAHLRADRKSASGRGTGKKARQPVRECRYLRALCLVEGRAAEGVGDERGPRRRVGAVKLHAVGHPRPSRLETHQQPRQAQRLQVSVHLHVHGYRDPANASYLIENGGPVLVFVGAGNVLTHPAAGGLVSRGDVDLILGIRRLKD